MLTLRVPALPRVFAGDKRKAAWDKYIDAAEQYNKPGEFTALIGWEWSSMPRGGNQHRVIFTPDDGTTARKFQPYSQLESENEESSWRCSNLAAFTTVIHLWDA
jgi:hypothetical protein